MKRYPQLFDPEFVEYWFAAEVSTSFAAHLYWLYFTVCYVGVYKCRWASTSLFIAQFLTPQEAVARGEQPPERPKSFFVPDPKRRADGSEEEDEVSGRSFRQRNSKSSKGDNNKAFSPKK